LGNTSYLLQKSTKFRFKRVKVVANNTKKKSFSILDVGNPSFLNAIKKFTCCCTGIDFLIMDGKIIILKI
jgi:hypothetical protein